ncbi:hypothetical protein C8A01DRAFT_34989 [Parachaetomium inaequale]|uniref:Uncharacterized protein n=1 Tax=Parachaetomium inaequale TaxID=2588326 RepID=A0AAN6PHF1_9PEZI|nr:hypothetical protein C8A01DRAFT_34989 [Parachaetomium inaequale]
MNDDACLEKVLAYPDMLSRLSAARKLRTERTKFDDVPLPGLSDWLPSLVIPGDGDAGGLLLKTFNDGYALGEVVVAMSFHLSTQVHKEVLEFVLDQVSTQSFDVSKIWIPGFITASVDWMKKRPRHVNRAHLEAVCDRFVEQDGFCNTHFNGVMDEHGRIGKMDLNPVDLVRFMSVLDDACPGSLARQIQQMGLSLSTVTTEMLQWFWIEWIEWGLGEELETEPGIAEFSTAILYTYACKSLGPPPPQHPDDLAWPVAIEEHMTDFWEFLADPVRPEGSFCWDPSQREAMKLVECLPRLEMSVDSETKPYTTVIRKRSRADPEHHTAWAKRKEDVREDALARFGEMYLRNMTGAF